MNDDDFKKLVKGVEQMGAILHGEDIPHRRSVVTNLDIRALRERTGLTQTEFSEMIGVSVRTLQNWEQGRREPEGPAKALLRVVERDPAAVLNALHA